MSFISAFLFIVLSICHVRQELIRHEGFTHRFKKDDIALIRLTQSIAFTRDVRPACLETDPSDISSDVKLNVTGWGTTSNTRKL